jgi:hypothetical protein
MPFEGTAPPRMASRTTATRILSFIIMRPPYTFSYSRLGYGVTLYNLPRKSQNTLAV